MALFYLWPEEPRINCYADRMELTRLAYTEISPLKLKSISMRRIKKKDLIHFTIRLKSSLKNRLDYSGLMPTYQSINFFSNPALFGKTSGVEKAKIL